MYASVYKSVCMSSTGSRGGAAESEGGGREVSLHLCQEGRGGVGGGAAQQQHKNRQIKLDQFDPGGARVSPPAKKYGISYLQVDPVQLHQVVLRARQQEVPGQHPVRLQAVHQGVQQGVNICESVSQMYKI